MDVHERLEAAAGFDWDAGNETKSADKHGVSTSECEQVFFNTPIIVQPDVKHSASESRFYLLGQTDAGRPLFVVFTLRSDLIRVISARDMSRAERRIYTEA